MTKLTDSDPSKIGPYDVVDRLGSGASGVVYKATDAAGRVVALKVLRPEIADQPQVRQRLAREAAALQKVEGSRTVRVIEVDAEGDRPYLAMEFVPGESLEEFITQNGPMKGANLWGLVEALIEALQSLEVAGVVHRDLKPSNVLIGPDGIKIVDFGISSLGESSGLTETGVVLGTASWLSPEQIDGGVISSSSDVFNLGLIISYAATGRHPFGEGRSDALMYRVAHSEPDLAGLSSSITQVVAACLQKNPAERPSLVALSNVISGMPSGDRDSESSSNHLADAIPQTRIVPPSLGAVDNSTSVTLPSALNTDAKESKVSPQKKWIFAGAAAVLLAVVGAAVFLNISNANKERADREAFENQFTEILDVVDSLEASNETYLTQMNEVERIFFGYDWRKNGYGSFTQYVESAGSTWWVERYDEIYKTFYSELNPELTRLRSTAFPESKNKAGLISIKNAFTEHYDTWLDYAQQYESAIDDYTYRFVESWTDVSNKNHERLSAGITQTFKTACNLLGDLQPVGGEINFASRIAKICES
jgi:serine/threonine protein kinase